MADAGQGRGLVSALSFDPPKQAANSFPIDKNGRQSFDRDVTILIFSSVGPFVREGPERGGNKGGLGGEGGCAGEDTLSSCKGSFI